MTVYRMQDRQGRGPFKPGFTAKWKGYNGLDMLPLYMELGISPQAMDELCPVDMFCGIGCASLEMFTRWFDRTERRRLFGFGYAMVVFEPSRILAETPTQVLFAHCWPLSTLRENAA